MFWSKIQAQLNAKIDNYLTYLDPDKLLLCILLGFVILLICMMIKKERLNMNTIIWCFSGSLWLSVILLITVLGRTHDAVNTWGTFFSTFYTLLEGNLGILYDILFNMVMFVPVGYLARMMFPEKSSIAIAFALSLLVEVMQLVTQSGLFELSDLIFNTAGGVIGVKIVSYAKKFNKYFY